MLVMNTGRDTMTVDLAGPDIDFLLEAIEAKKHEVNQWAEQKLIDWDEARKLASECDAWEIALEDCR